MAFPKWEQINWACRQPKWAQRVRERKPLNWFFGQTSINHFRQRSTLNSCCPLAQCVQGQPFETVTTRKNQKQKKVGCAQRLSTRSTIMIERNMHERNTDKKDDAEGWPSVGLCWATWWKAREVCKSAQAVTALQPLNMWLWSSNVHTYEMLQFANLQGLRAARTFIYSVEFEILLGPPSLGNFNLQSLEVKVVVTYGKNWIWEFPYCM